MKMLDLQVLETALQWLQQDRPIWLATVLHTYGSAPRSPGALFVADANGQYYGSLSGGCIEEDFLEKIQTGFFTEKSEEVVYGEQSEQFRPTTTLPCGGTIDLLVEYICPSDERINYLKTMISALKGHNILRKKVVLGEYPTLATAVEANNLPFIQHHGTHMELTIRSYTTLFIAGISAVGLYCMEFADQLGFAIIVADDREEEIRQLKSLPIYERVTFLEIFPAQYIESNTISAQTAIISLTHDPRIDDLTMLAALETPAFYIGAMGSKRNSASRMERLKSCSDFTNQELSRIHAPIGLSIGSKTPAEIALAIMADIVKAKNGK